MFLKSSFGALALVVATAASAGPTDIIYGPQFWHTGAHDINHTPVGQTFTALASNVTAGIWIADDQSLWDLYIANGIPLVDPRPSDSAVAPSLNVTVALYGGEEIAAEKLLASNSLTLTRNFAGFVDVSTNGLVVGDKYTVVLTDNGYPSGSSFARYWAVPGVFDGNSIYDYSLTGAYKDGFGILQGVKAEGTTNAFHVLDASAMPVAAPVPEPETYALLLAGLGLLGFMARRSRARRA